VSACRLIYEHLFHEPDFCSLPPRVQVALIACMCATDDWGRGRTISLVSLGKLSHEESADARRLINATGILRFYGRDGAYYYAPKFFTYQRIKYPAATTIPAPPDPEFDAASQAYMERVGAKRRDAARRQSEHRARKTPSAVFDPDDLTTPLPGDAPAEPVSRRCGKPAAAPANLAPRLRQSFDEIVGLHGIETACRALEAAQRFFPMPSEKQLAQTLQAAVDAGVLAEPADRWPDFRARMANDRMRELNPAGHTPTNDADVAAYEGRARRVTT
jgi:hypothetical protein